MNTTSRVVVRQAGAGRTVAIVGDVYRFLAVGDETNGRYTLWEAIVPPGGGPPPHTHSREEEGFYVLEGEITFTVGDQRLVAGAGTPHAFKNESGQAARMLMSVAPAGLEKMFFEFGVPLSYPAPVERTCTHLTPAGGVPETEFAVPVPVCAVRPGSYRYNDPEEERGERGPDMTMPTTGGRKEDNPWTRCGQL
jgi:quercetin dioxygenase-like cupin family protein